jgi:hypothetical protein
MSLYIIVHIEKEWHVKNIVTFKTVAIRDTQIEAYDLMERLNDESN